MTQLGKVFLLQLLLLFIFASHLLCANSEIHQQSSSRFIGRRKFLEIDESSGDEEESLVITKPKKKISPPSVSNSLSSKKNQTKTNNNTNKPNNLSSPKNQTKLIKTTNLSSKNQTKITTKKTNSTKTTPKKTTTTTTLLSPQKTELKTLNSTSKPKKLNSTTKPVIPIKKSLDLIKPKNTQPTKTTAKKSTPTPSNDQSTPKNDNDKPKKKTTSKPGWFDDDDTDFMSEFTGLPLKFQQSLIPDLEKISTTSKAYINRANKDLAQNFKPIIGPKYAPTAASLVSLAFMLIPLLLVSLLFNRIKAYFSIQKLLIFVQVYLSIYFAILCISSLVTGLEPLRFFYTTSRSTYVCVQLLQTLAYVLYLLLLLMYLVLVFSTESGLGSKMLGLAQMFVGFSVGLHYYVAVFHRLVLRHPPRTNWKVHGIYATCFFLICLCAMAERRKKAYLEEGGEEGKKN